MKKFLIFPLLFIAIAGCNSNTPKAAVGKVSINKDSLALEQKNISPERKDSVHLKNIVVNEQAFLSKKYYNKLDRTAQRKYSIRRLDPHESDGFNYYIYDSLYTAKNIQVLLLSRIWPEENIVWLAIYNTDMQLTDFQQVYYDNSEGSLSIQAIVKDDLIKITTDDIYEEKADAKKTVTWYIDAKNKLVKK